MSSSYSNPSSPEFSFPAHGPSLIRSQSLPASFAAGRWGSLGDSPVHAIQAGLQDTEWGIPTSLDGLLGTVFICHEALQQTQTRALHAAGEEIRLPASDVGGGRVSRWQLREMSFSHLSRFRVLDKTSVKEHK